MRPVSVRPLWLLALVVQSASAQSAPVRVHYEASAGSVSDSGLYLSPPSPGTVRVRARSGTTTTIVQGTVVGGREAPAISGNKPWLDEDFSRYTSADQFRSNPFGLMPSPPPRWWHQQAISFGPGYGDSPHSLQYNWWGDNPSRSQCSKDIAIEARYKMPNVSELWIEAVHKFATNFDTNPHCGVKGYKFLLFWRTADDRFDLLNGVNGHEWWSGHPATQNEALKGKCSGLGFNCRLGYGTGQSQFLPVIPGNLWDGQWHIYRAHIKLPNTKGEKTGVFELWIDGTLVKRVTDQDFIHRKGLWSNRLKSISLGSNSNSGTSRSTQTNWGRLRVWTSDPHW